MTWVSSIPEVCYWKDGPPKIVYLDPPRRVLFRLSILKDGVVYVDG